MMNKLKRLLKGVHPVLVYTEEKRGFHGKVVRYFGLWGSVGKIMIPQE